MVDQYLSWADVFGYEDSDFDDWVFLGSKEKYRIFGKVQNGKSWIWHDQQYGYFYRTLSGAKLYDPKQRIKQPRNLDKSIWREFTSGRWEKI